MDPQTLRAGNAGTEPLVKNAETPPSTFEIAIFLCTYNGRLFLKDQIDSIIAQTYENWTIYISDDGSTDGTLELLKHYQALVDTQRIQILSGPRKGFAENFMSLIRNTEISADFFPFATKTISGFTISWKKVSLSSNRSPPIFPLFTALALAWLMRIRKYWGSHLISKKVRPSRTH
ncbi:glycosyltransferase [Pseudomonas sp. R3-56]|uniref:glycosyltransferase n=1 Tax=Pseudomonas sp. R3-56 TaxID=2817401 RepID=UPI003DA845AA